MEDSVSDQQRQAAVATATRLLRLVVFTGCVTVTYVYAARGEAPRFAQVFGIVVCVGLVAIPITRIAGECIGRAAWRIAGSSTISVTNLAFALALLCCASVVGWMILFSR